jgi:hypothetical protein
MGQRGAAPSCSDDECGRAPATSDGTGRKADGDGGGVQFGRSSAACAASILPSGDRDYHDVIINPRLFLAYQNILNLGTKIVPLTLILNFSKQFHS